MARAVSEGPVVAVKSEAPVVGGLLTAMRKEVVASLEEFAEEKLLKLLMPAEKCWQPQVSAPPEEPLPGRASRGPHQAGPRNRGSGSGEPRTGGGGGGVRAPAPAPRAMAPAGRRRSRSRPRLPNAASPTASTSAEKPG